ncbi:MAG: 16S rRNA (uracil(1498)-N(3))-methyltransferase [Smithellaceae bacterium]|nr:16S rRNA (uracil(1498)-N(3))-methyltransferase [Smithellaceae bacterium]
MTVPRIYVPAGIDETKPFQLEGEYFRYVKSILRMGVGDSLRLFDGRGNEFEARIARIGKDEANVEIVVKRPAEENDIRITLAQGLAKAGKVDQIVRRTTELGIDRFIPFDSKRAVPRLSQERAQLKTDRWKKIALEAARQCGRPTIPFVEDILSFKEMLTRPDSHSGKIIFWEEEARLSFKDIMRDLNNDGIRDFFLVVGPEGGFGPEEVEQAMSAGFASASLGRLILKVETAAPSIISILQYERGSLGSI